VPPIGASAYYKSLGTITPSTPFVLPDGRSSLNTGRIDFDTTAGQLALALNTLRADHAESTQSGSMLALGTGPLRVSREETSPVGAFSFQADIEPSSIGENGVDVTVGLEWRITFLGRAELSSTSHHAFELLAGQSNRCSEGGAATMAMSTRVAHFATTQCSSPVCLSGNCSLEEVSVLGHAGSELLIPSV